jgi:hypothetical protein
MIKFKSIQSDDAGAIFPTCASDAMASIRMAMQSLNVHIKKHGLPSAVKLDEKWIALCEKPFPLSEGNIAEEEIQLFRVAHEMNGRRVDIYRDEMNRKVTITIS